MLAEIEAEVRFALGSGTRGIAYLIERDGFLFQSPITWFAQKGRWDISPGYGEPSPRPNFERIIEPECLFCHTNQLHPVAGTLNRYEPPIFEGHAIGCERCHGPGELHVNRRGQSTEPDLTIVNPANLAPALRDSVCQQCHLQGWFRFPRAGRELLRLPPGPAVAPVLGGLRQEERQTGQARGRSVKSSRWNRVVVSARARASSVAYRATTRTGCPSRPPRLPITASAVSSATKRRAAPCRWLERQARGQGEDCIACHMPRSAVTNIPHTAETDHRIPRGVPGPVPEGPSDPPGLPGKLRPAGLSLGADD